MLWFSAGFTQISINTVSLIQYLSSMWQQVEQSCQVLRLAWSTHSIFSCFPAAAGHRWEEWSLLCIYVKRNRLDAEFMWSFVNFGANKIKFESQVILFEPRGREMSPPLLLSMLLFCLCYLFVFTPVILGIFLLGFLLIRCLILAPYIKGFTSF